MGRVCYGPRCPVTGQGLVDQVYAVNRVFRLYMDLFRLPSVHRHFDRARIYRPF